MHPDHYLRVKKLYGYILLNDVEFKALKEVERGTMFIRGFIDDGWIQTPHLDLQIRYRFYQTIIRDLYNKGAIDFQFSGETTCSGKKYICVLTDLGREALEYTRCVKNE